MSWLAAEKLVLIPEDQRHGWLHRAFQYPGTVGITGLRTVPPDGTESFWGYRRNRTTISHLCHGTKEPTDRVCLWGWWDGEIFIVHTLYPGEAAPREIHDPELPLDEVAKSLEFWRNHAIVVNKGDWSETHD